MTILRGKVNTFLCASVRIIFLFVLYLPKPWRKQTYSVSIGLELSPVMT